MEYIVYDCEIIKCIPPKDKRERVERLEYCEGWSDFESMEISVVGWFSTKFGFGYWANEENFPITQMISFGGHDQIIGFNSRNFDDNLMAANGMQVRTTYDLLEEVRIAAGFGADYQSVPKGYSYSLDSIACANGMAKTGSGALAPQLWQEGKRQEVIDYCCHDVKITVDLLELGWAGNLIDPNTNELLQLKPLEEG